MSICVICGKEFTPPHRSVRKTCSDECHRKYRAILGQKPSVKGAKTRYLKTCVVCGKEFYTKTVSTKTCSRECFKKLRAELQTGISNKWPPEAREKMVERWKNSPVYYEIGQNFHAAAMKNPINQRGPQNIRSKEWVLVSPEGEVVRVINLKDWVRNHIQEYFGCEPTEKNIDRVTGRFAKTKRSLHGKRPIEDGNPKTIKSLNGWGLLDWSDEPKPVEIDDMKTQE